jgi:Fur family ferric uptake transcriptional regulator
MKKTTTSHTHTSAHTHDEEAHILLVLKDAGYRITLPRRKIARALGTAKTPKTAKEIAARTHIKDASTVYRTLTELTKEGIVHTVTSEGVAYFEVSHTHHDHVVCTSCGVMEHITCVISKPRALSRAGWHITSHEAVFKGVCATCKE